MSFDPSDGLTLWFPGVRVRLRGRNFAAALAGGVSFLDALQRHRVAWVQEVDPLRGATAPPAAVVVTAVELVHGR